MIKAVLDTNIFAGAFLAKNGYTSRILKAGVFEVIASEYILEEIREVLSKLRIRKKYNFTGEEIELFINSIRNISTLTPDKLKVTDLDKRDPADNNILACAIEGKAEYIVTRDNDILDINPYHGIKIVLPDYFYALLGKK